MCIYSRYYKGVWKSKFLTKFAPYVAIIMCHFGLGLTLPSEGKGRGEKMLRHWMSGMCAGQAADLSWTWHRSSTLYPGGGHGMGFALLSSRSAPGSDGG